MRWSQTILFSLLSLPLVTFAEDGDYQRLYSARADATSFLRSNWNKYEENYHPNYALDDNPKTAWVEGAAGNGAGESLVIRVSPLPSARSVKLRFRNGYQKSKALFRANARPAQVRLELLQKDRSHSAREVTLKDEMGWQEVVLPVAKTAGFDAVRLTLLSTKKGRRYKDTCLSDVQVWVNSAVPYLADVELGKKARLGVWIKERVERAAYFAKVPPAYPFAFTEFENDKAAKLESEAEQVAAKTTAVDALKGGERPRYRGDALTPEQLDDLAALFARLVKVKDSGPWYAHASTTKFRAPAGPLDRPGYEWLNSWGMKYLRRSDFSLFEAATQRAYALPVSGDGPRISALSHVRQTPVGKGLDVALTWKQVYHERVVTEVTQDLLLVYGATGFLERVFIWSRSDDEIAESTSERLGVTDLVWRDGKVDSLTHRGVASTHWLEDEKTKTVSDLFHRTRLRGLAIVAAK